MSILRRRWTMNTCRTINDGEFVIPSLEITDKKQTVEGLISDYDILPILLKEHSTGKNLVWATDIYSHRGHLYESESQIMPMLITGFYIDVIKPRVKKCKNEQRERSKENGEVFTPSWLCNQQNNLVDNAWFEKIGLFNTEVTQGWKTNHEKITFWNDKCWKDYVVATRLEVSCGEAPYLISRYDTVSGKNIPVPDRIGLLDRKLRVISENVNNPEDWIVWAIKAMENIYAYDIQGDNVLLARKNALFTIIEHFEFNYNKKIDLAVIETLAEIISWNVFQMDGLKFVVPHTCCEDDNVQLSLFDMETEESICQGCKLKDNSMHNGTYSLVKDWKTKRKIRFIDLTKGN